MMDEYTPCKKPDPTAREAIGNIMRLVRAQNKKPNKYHARKTAVYGIAFDSKREAEIYLTCSRESSTARLYASDCSRPIRSLRAFGTIRATSRGRLHTQRISLSPMPMGGMR